MTGFTLDRTRLARSLVAVLLLSAPATARASSGSDELLGGDIGNAVFTLVIFVALVVVLGKIAWKPLLHVLNERERNIRESLQAARSEREQAARLLAEYQAQLDKARVEATALVDEGRRDAEATKQRILEEARRETTEISERARREIKLAADAAVKELYDKTAELAVDVAGRVLGRQLSPQDQARLIDESMAEVRRGGPPAMN